MKSIKEVKDEYARTLNNGHGGKFKDWGQFSRSAYIDNEDIEGIARLYAQSQTQELQEQNAELVDLVERCRDVIYAYNDYKPTAKGNEILQALQERLTKYNHLNKSHDSKRESD